MRSRRTKLVIVVATLVVVTGLLVFGSLGIAGADDSSTGGASGWRHGSSLTDAQKQCLSAQGVAFPDHTAGQRPSQDQMQAFRQQLQAAAQACGITFGGRRSQSGTI
jgi:hypothetical protein